MSDFWPWLLALRGTLVTSEATGTQRKLVWMTGKLPRECGPDLPH